MRGPAKSLPTARVTPPGPGGSSHSRLLPKDGKQAEFLIERRFPWDLIRLAYIHLNTAVRLIPFLLTPLTNQLCRFSVSEASHEISV